VQMLSLVNRFLRLKSNRNVFYTIYILHILSILAGSQRHKIKGIIKMKEDVYYDEVFTKTW